MLSKTNAYLNSQDGQTKLMYFFIEDYDLIEKYYITWDKASADIKKKFDSKNVHDKFF